MGENGQNSWRLRQGAMDKTVGYEVRNTHDRYRLGHQSVITYPFWANRSGLMYSQANVRSGNSEVSVAHVISGSEKASLGSMG